MSASQNKTRRLECNLIKQNVYVRDFVAPYDAPVKTVSQYPELKRENSQFGFEEKVVVSDYPITPESVNSYAETADYRNNLQEALNSPSRGKGLGDIRDLQDLQNLDTSVIRERIEALNAVLVSKALAESETKVESEIKKDGE